MSNATSLPDESTGTPASGREERRDRSTIGCPYWHLEGAVEIAVAVHNLGIDSCEWDQLATATGQSPQGGSFRQKMISSRMFGLLTYVEQRVELTPLGRRVADPTTLRGAKVDAFLTVPLFAQAFERLKGGPLPSHEAIERRMVEFGVASKRAEKARQVFLRSAKYAGFFELAMDRMAKPSIAHPKQSQDPGGDRDSPNGDSPDAGGAPKQPRRHPLIEALLDEMPPTGQEWEKSHCTMWLRTFLLSIGMLYSNRDELQQIQIGASDQGTRGADD